MSVRNETDLKLSTREGSEMLLFQFAIKVLITWWFQVSEIIIATCVLTFEISQLYKKEEGDYSNLLRK